LGLHSIISKIERAIDTGEAAAQTLNEISALLDRCEAGTGDPLLALKALSVPAIKLCYRPFRTDLGRPNWHNEFVRLTRSICVDARTVSATGVDTGLASALTWAQVKTLETTYSAQVCVLMNPYHSGFDGYTNTDASITNGGGGTSDATHIANIATKFGLIRTNYIDALGGTVRTVFLDTEVFAALANTAGNAAHNNALKLKFQNVYDKVVHATTGFPNCTYVNWFGLGAAEQGAFGDAMTPVSATDSGPGGPFPWGQRFGMQPWNVNHYDETDTTPAYTAGGSVPFIEVANSKMTIGPVLYRPQDYEGARRAMIESDRLYNATGIWAALSRPIIPWLTMGAGYRAAANTGSQPSGTVASYGAMTYDTAQSYWYGIIFHDAFHATMMPKPDEVILWESPNDPNYPAWMDHFVAFCQGAVT